MQIVVIEGRMLSLQIFNVCEISKETSWTEIKELLQDFNFDIWMFYADCAQYASWLLFTGVEKSIKIKVP